MAESEIRLPSDLPLTGPRVRVIQHTIGGVDVNSDVVLLTNLAGDIIDWQIIDSKPRVSSTPYAYDIAEGNVPDHESVFIFGHNGNVPVTLETICDQSAVLTYLAAAELLKVSSDSAQDDEVAVGTGAHRLVITGLDDNYDEITDTIILDGAVVVTSNLAFLRVHACYVTTVGTGGVNAGNISINDNADVVTLNYIEADHGHSHSANYTVPAGHTLYVTDFYATESSSKGSEIHLFRRVLAGATRLSWGSLRVFALFDSTFTMKPSTPFAVPEKTDLEIRARALQAGAVVTAGLVGWVES